MTYGNHVKAVILAGGKGTRFRPYTDVIAKPMIPVGREEKPILEHIISWLSKMGIRDIVMLVGYHGKQIRNYFRDGRYWDVNIVYSWDDDEYTDTGGALLKAYKEGHAANGTLLVWYGDILAPLNVRDLLRRHVDLRADATVVLASRYRIPVGLAEVDLNDNIVRLREKPLLDINVTIGVLTLSTKTLGEARRELGKRFDIMGDLLPWLISRGRTVKAYKYEGPWYDIGSLERYKKFNHEEIREFFAP